MENMNNEKQLYVQKEPFEYNGKTYNHYYIKGMVRGREVKIDLAPPNKDTDMGGYTVLDIVFGDADREILSSSRSRSRTTRPSRSSAATAISCARWTRTARCTNALSSLRARRTGLCFRCC